MQSTSKLRSLSINDLLINLSFHKWKLRHFIRLTTEEVPEHLHNKDHRLL